MKNETFTATVIIMLACLAMSLSTADVVTGKLTASIGIISAIISLRFFKQKSNVHDKR